MAVIGKKQAKKLIDDTNVTLYKFSLSKMKAYLLKDSIFNLFMFYYETEIKNGRRLVTNKTMSKHVSLYEEAFKILVNFLQKSKSGKNVTHSILS